MKNKKIIWKDRRPALLPRAAFLALLLFSLAGNSACQASREDRILPAGLEETQAESNALQTSLQETASVTQTAQAEPAQPEAETAAAESLSQKADPVVFPEEEPQVLVYICGAVENPGVYELPADGRVYQVLEEAGGFAEGAARSYLNLADGIADGMKIVVPYLADLEEGLRYGEKTPSGTEAGFAAAGAGQDHKSSVSGDGRISLNTASAAELMTLSGIGEVRAARIIAWREENGAFTDVEDLLKVDGISRSLLDKIKEKITV